MEKAVAFPHLVMGQGDGHIFIARGRSRWVWKHCLGRFPEGEGATRGTWPQFVTFCKEV